MASTDVLLVTATNIETHAVFQVFREANGKEPHPKPLGNKTYHDLGIIQDTRVHLVQSEMGSASLGASQQTVKNGIETLKPNAVIMVGIAFGVNSEKQAIGDVLVAKHLMPYEPQRVGTKKTLSRGAKADCSSRLLDRCRSAELYWKGASVHFGLILSGEKLVDNLKFRQKLLNQEPEAIGGEMEGAGLYVACQELKTDWILVKAICDWGDGNKARNKIEQQSMAARNAATFVLAVIQQGSLHLEQGRKRVEILLEGAFEDFTPTRRTDLVNILAGLLKIDSKSIRILDVRSGSIKVVLELPESEANSLKEIWGYIGAQLKSERERLAFFERYLYEISPKEIARRHPQHFSTALDVSRTIANAVVRLMRDPDFRARAEDWLVDKG